MIKSCQFETPIAGSYLRNNRSTRQKSLRCFPACDPRGHIAAGFCGVPLRVRIHLTTDDENESELNIHSYLFIAETRPVNTPGISSHATVSKQSIMQNIRTKSDKASEKGELFVGDVAVLAADKKSMEIQVTFNAQHCSWDYSWKSNRWSGSQELHIVDIVVLKYSTLSDFLVCSSSPSTPFIVASSHKRAHRPESSDAEVLQASTLLTTLCGPSGNSSRAQSSQDGSVASATNSSHSDHGRSPRNTTRTRKSTQTAVKEKSELVSPKLEAPEVEQSGSQPQQRLANLSMGLLPQQILQPQIYAPVPMVHRDKSLAEGAETLMSLLGPIVHPRSYIYEQTNKRMRVEEAMASPLKFSLASKEKGSDNEDASSGSHVSPSLNLIFLPVRE